ncbi:MAG: DUF5615 family PIN-like protein [Leptospiraceae bacterium]|nr:DUF5615 family PIN-like protein [Leptospiraceae bacterium]
MLLFDANLSPELVSMLADLFPNSQHVFTYSLEKDDKEIWEFAFKENLIIVTKDEDFANILERFGAPPKVILIKRGNCPTKTIESILRVSEEQIKILIKDASLSLLILR